MALGNLNTNNINIKSPSQLINLYDDDKIKLTQEFLFGYFIKEAEYYRFSGSSNNNTNNTNPNPNNIQRKISNNNIPDINSHPHILKYSKKKNNMNNIMNIINPSNLLFNNNTNIVKTYNNTNNTNKMMMFNNNRDNKENENPEVFIGKMKPLLVNNMNISNPNSNFIDINYHIGNISNNSIHKNQNQVVSSEEFSINQNN